jgi:hypothetical protein
MGGREIELLVGTDSQSNAHHPAVLEQALRAVESGAMIHPTSVPGVGPFPNAALGWVGARQGDEDAIARAHLYAALVADASLDLIGSRDTLVIDGRFSTAPVFVQALARLRPATRVFVSNDEHGVARGALHLVNGIATDTALDRVCPLPIDLTEYRARWRVEAEKSVVPPR